jgi:hypothetical protein
MRTILLASVLALAAASGCARDKANTSETAGHVRELSLDEVERGIAANELTAIDCNGDRLRKKHGVLPGAVLLDDEETFLPDELPADKARRLVFYCSGPG